LVHGTSTSGGAVLKQFKAEETRISRNGDGSVRAVLYEAGHLILTRPLKGCTALKSWAMRIAKRAGTKKAAVALARKLAVIMHRMLADGTPFTTQPA
jgi:transposase